MSQPPAAPPPPSPPVERKGTVYQRARRARLKEAAAEKKREEAARTRFTTLINGGHAKFYSPHPLQPQLQQYQNQQRLAFNEWQQMQMSQASSQNHGTSATATKADEEILAGNQLMALAASAAPAPMAAKESDEEILAVNQLLALAASAAPAPMAAKESAGNTVQAPVEKATEAPAPMAAKESASRLLAVNQLLALAASTEPAPPTSESVINPICYVCTHIFEIISNKWVQQFNNGTMHFRLMAFGSHTYLLCTITVTTLLHNRTFRSN